MKKLLSWLPLLMLAPIVLGTPSFAANACQKHCASCARTCDAAAGRLEKKKGDAELIKTMRDCAAKCRHHAKKFSAAESKACSEACSACATACEKSGDASLKQCMEECKSCSDCCAK